jgi:hypothetical protein
LDGDLELAIRWHLCQTAKIKFGDISFRGWSRCNRLEWNLTDDTEKNEEIRGLLQRNFVLLQGQKRIMPYQARPGSTYTLREDTEVIKPIVGWNEKEIEMEVVRSPLISSLRHGQR